MDYQHIRCDLCRGVIGEYNRKTFACERCGKEFPIYSLNYDRLMINDKTGQIFPVIDRRADDEPMVSIYNLDSGKDEELYDSYGDIIEWLRKEADIPESNAGKWIPADQPPETDETEMSDYVLLSFENLPVPLVGIYELDEEGNGAYYVGDSEKSCISQGYVVNAWMPLPEQYKGGQDE